MDSMKYGSISTGSKESSITAKKILVSGGNAFDAAVGAVFTSMTSEFALTGPFGGGSCTGIKNGQPFIYDFFVDCPKHISNKKEFEQVSVNFGETIQKFHTGKGSIATPGNLAGLLTIHKNYGALPLERVLKPAIGYAKEGIVIGKYQAYILKLIKPILTFTDNDLFFNQGKYIKEGDNFKNPAFADFLNIILDKGYKYFYTGNGLKNIFKYLGNDSCLSNVDFKEYQVYKRDPISIKFNDHIIYTNPSPSFGGNLIIFLLKLIKESNKTIDIFNLIKGMNLASKVREEICKDPNDEYEIDKIFSNKIFKKYLKKYSDERTYDLASEIDGHGSTTHVSVMDKKGNAVSITTTNGEGCGSIIPEYGIMMNNMLGEADLNPFGFHNWKLRRRLPTMISPIIITKNSHPKFVLGSGGSNRIRSANIQVILNLLVHKMNLFDAISSPRIHLEGKTLFYEPGISLSNNNKIKNIKFNSFNNKNLFFGGVNAVSENEAVGDDRRGGYGIIN